MPANSWNGLRFTKAVTFTALCGRNSSGQESGAWALLEIDVEGARNVMARYPEAITVFLRTPSVDEYERRLRARGTESEDVIARRLKTAQEELEFIHLYRHQVVNDDLEQAVSRILDILAQYQAGPHAG